MQKETHDFTEKHTDTVNMVLGRFMTHRRGETVKHEELESLIGLSRNDCTYWHIVNRVRKKLLKPEYGGIATRGNPDVGFHLQTISEQVNDQSRDRKAARQQHRKQKELQAVPDKLLDDHGRNVKAMKIAQAKKNRSVIRASMKTDQVIFRATEALPRMGTTG